MDTIVSRYLQAVPLGHAALLAALVVLVIAVALTLTLGGGSGSITLANGDATPFRWA